jgi:hypothetical protein
LIWDSDRNYVRLDSGLTGVWEVVLLGCLENQDQVIGRGRLPGPTPEPSSPSDGDRVWLRLKRAGDRVIALCSADGQAWFTVGHAPFAAQDPVHVGVYACGEIQRSIYHGAYPDGTAIRFESFQLWRGTG